MVEELDSLDTIAGSRSTSDRSASVAAAYAAAAAMVGPESMPGVMAYRSKSDSDDSSSSDGFLTGRTFSYVDGVCVILTD